MRKASYTEEQLIEAVKASGSWRQVLSKLGLVEAGGIEKGRRDVKGESLIWKLMDKFRVFLLGHHYPCRRYGCFQKGCRTHWW
jgi:hypothetical protein